ncbi:unnamed protein product [Parajaminaea phylloscopi]
MGRKFRSIACASAVALVSASMPASVQGQSQCACGTEVSWAGRTASRSKGKKRAAGRPPRGIRAHILTFLLAVVPFTRPDPSTNLVWTDAVISYFNETTSNVVLDPAKTPSPYGSKSSGDTGTGSEDWATYQSLNAYNEGWGINWRTGWRFNNTYSTTDADHATQALQLAVIAADLRNRITWGAGLVTRRRDILHGSFRTSVLPSPSSNEGTFLSMGVAYDEQDYLRTTLAASWNATLNWEWAARGEQPVNVTQVLWTGIGWNAQHNYTEHRMQWNSANQVGFTNNGDLSNGGSAGTTLDGNLPTAGGPFSFLHYSDGDFNIGQAPPEGFQLNANVLYARLFFNSSLPTRSQEFEEQCAAAGGAQVCDTEDVTLRGSTAFTAAAMQAQHAPKPAYKPRSWSVALCAATAAVFAALLLHGLLVRLAGAFTDGRGEYDRASTSRRPSPLFSERSGQKGADADDGIPLEDPRSAYPAALLSSDSRADSFYDTVEGGDDRDAYSSKGYPDGNQKYHSFQSRTVGSSASGIPLLPAHATPSESTYTWQSPRQVMSPTLQNSPKAAGSGWDLASQSPMASKSPLHQSAAHGQSDFDAVEWEPTSTRMGAASRLARPIGGPQALRKKKAQVDAAVSAASIWSRIKGSLFIGEGGGGKTASGAARVEYLDGLRGFACFLVSFHHFMLIFYYAQTTQGAYEHYPKFETWFRNILGPVFTNGGLNVGIFFCLAARVIANRYLVRGKLQDLAEAIFRRVPRLMLPITAAIILNYFLIEAGAFYWVTRLTSVTWSPWSYYVDYQNVGVFFDAWLSLWFTIPPNTPMQISTYATGILWTVPLIVQYSWSVFLCALIAKEIPNVKKRYAFYGACWLLSWYAGRFEYFFIAGLIIADLDNRVHYREKAAAGIPIIPGTKIRVHGQVFAWIIFLVGAVFTWLDQIGGTGSTIFTAEYNIHPAWTTSQPNGWSVATNVPLYTSPELFAFFFVIGFFLLCDLCTSFRTFFQLKFWSVFGRNAFSLYLLHGVIFWSWGAWLTITLVARDVPYWAAVLVTFITSYIMLGILCECFTRTFDNWGIGLSKSLWRECSGGLGRRV